MELSFDPRENLSQSFPTPIGTFTVPGALELMPKIADAILARENAEDGIKRSNKGGWHSDDHLLHWPELEFADLASTFRSATSHMIAITSRERRFNLDLALSAWANVNRQGSFNSPHIHPRHHWSGVLYVRAPDFSDDPMDMAGNIEFQDPRGAVNMMRSPGESDVISLSPRQGTILIFPSWLYHWVNPFTIDTVRISIAFNARIRKFEKLND